MTDPISCPECEGRGETAIGPLRLRCRFCHGRKTVGGDFEPAEGGHQRADGYRNPVDGETYDPDVHGPLPAVQDHPAVQALPGCPLCLGTRVVVNLGDIYRRPATELAERPCPGCSSRT